MSSRSTRAAWSRRGARHDTPAPPPPADAAAGALIGGFIIGITESLGGLFLGEALGQIGISLIFILILLFKPTGLFGART